MYTRKIEKNKVITLFPWKSRKTHLRNILNCITGLFYVIILLAMILIMRYIVIYITKGRIPDDRQAN